MTKEQFQRLTGIIFDLNELHLPMGEPKAPGIRANFASAVTVNIWFENAYRVQPDVTEIIYDGDNSEKVERIIAQCEYALQLGISLKHANEQDKTETFEGFARQLFADIDDISKRAELLRKLTDEYVKEILP